MVELLNFVLMKISCCRRGNRELTLLSIRWIFIRWILIFWSNWTADHLFFVTDSTTHVFHNLPKLVHKHRSHSGFSRRREGGESVLFSRQVYKTARSGGGRRWEEGGKLSVNRHVAYFGCWGRMDSELLNENKREKRTERTHHLPMLGTYSFPNAHLLSTPSPRKVGGDGMEMGE